MNKYIRFKKQEINRFVSWNVDETIKIKILGVVKS